MDQQTRIETLRLAVDLAKVTLADRSGLSAHVLHEAKRGSEDSDTLGALVRHYHGLLVQLVNDPE